MISLGYGLDYLSTNHARHQVPHKLNIRKNLLIRVSNQTFLSYNIIVQHSSTFKSLQKENPPWYPKSHKHD